MILARLTFKFLIQQTFYAHVNLKLRVFFCILLKIKIYGLYRTLNFCDGTQVKSPSLFGVRAGTCSNVRTRALHVVNLQPVREAVSYRGLFTSGWFGVRGKHCSRLEIYDRLRASEQTVA